MKHVKPQLTKRQLGFLLIGLAVLVLGIGLATAWQLRAQRQQIVQTAAHKVVKNSQVSQPQPVADKPAPDEFASYQVAANMPRYLRIPSLSTAARVRSVGLLKDNSIAAPSNVYDAAWYNGSAKPGSPGAAFIDGHVSSWTSDGVFYNLKKAKAGMLIQVEMGSGTVYTYKVVSTTTYPVASVDMTAALSPVVAGKQGLNLMTCTGKVIKGTSEFDSRLLVRAVRV